MKYRKRPVVIEANQFDPDIKPWPDGVVLYQPPDAVIGGRGHGEFVLPQDSYPAVQTLEGVMRVKKGDWVIVGVKGEIYPCADVIFMTTYEPASAR